MCLSRGELDWELAIVSELSLSGSMGKRTVHGRKSDLKKKLDPKQFLDEMGQCHVF